MVPVVKWADLSFAEVAGSPRFFMQKPCLGLIENSTNKETVSASCVDKNALLMSEEWGD